MTIQNSKLEKERFKEEFKKRIKQFALNLIPFVDFLPNDRKGRDNFGFYNVILIFEL